MLCKKVNTVLYAWLLIFVDWIYMDFIRFLIHEDLYAWRLRYICSAWFLEYIKLLLLVYQEAEGGLMAHQQHWYRYCEYQFLYWYHICISKPLIASLSLPHSYVLLLICPCTEIKYIATYVANYILAIFAAYIHIYTVGSC